MLRHLFDPVPVQSKVILLRFLPTELSEANHVSSVVTPWKTCTAWGLQIRTTEHRTTYVLMKTNQYRSHYLFRVSLRRTEQTHLLPNTLQHARVSGIKVQQNHNVKMIHAVCNTRLDDNNNKSNLTINQTCSCPKEVLKVSAHCSKQINEQSRAPTTLDVCLCFSMCHRLSRLAVLTNKSTNNPAKILSAFQEKLCHYASKVTNWSIKST